MNHNRGSNTPIFSRLANRAKDLLFIKPMIPYWRREAGRQDDGLPLSQGGRAG